MLATLKQIDKFLDRHVLLIVILAGVLLLRIPNLCEPYWYGDEAIYLTIGQTLNKGETLYKEIIDHKTPIIYYLARVHTQLNFRILNIVWMLVATTLFYVFSMSIFKGKWQAFWATLIFAILTTFPWFEGNIPNGELFVIGFMMVGAVFLMKTNYWQGFIQAHDQTKISRQEFGWLFAAGVFFSLGVLTKVPAVFDLAAFLMVGWFGLFEDFKNIKKCFLRLLPKLMAIGAGVATPIVLSILYFLAKGAGADYLQFGLLYNFHYAGNWDLGFSNSILKFLFTLPGKALVVGSIIFLVTVLGDKVKSTTKFIVAWFFLALMASLLSNRPYPHYFIQMVPPFALLLVMGINQLHQLSKKMSLNTLVGSALFLIGMVCITSVILLLNVRPYAFGEYYGRWLKVVTSQITKEEYRQSFNYLNNDNYRLAKLLRTQGQDKLFIWGTNPMLYALADTAPTGRFTVSFHIKDIGTYDETMKDLIEDAPLYIVVMNDEHGEFPEFYDYLNAHYEETEEKFENFVLWRRFDITEKYL